MINHFSCTIKYFHVFTMGLTFSTVGGTCQLSCCGTEPETSSCTQRVVPWSQHFHDVEGPDELFALGLPTGPSEQDVTEGAVHIQQTLRCT